MPELPEVETIVRSLSPKLQGLKIKSVRLLFPALLKNENKAILKRLQGRAILGLRRRGKMILLDFENNLTLLLHLKMTGQLLLCPELQPFDKHTHFILSFKEKKEELRFRDIRKFGFLCCFKTSEIFKSEALKNLGPEPFELDFSSFSKLFRRRKARLKSLLLNQSFIAGIGNIYADEILFEAKLHPLVSVRRLKQRELKRLWEALHLVLRKALSARGSSIRDYVDADGREGGYQNFHKAYGREGLPCFCCREKIQRLRLGGRSSFFCARCQKRV